MSVSEKQSIKFTSPVKSYLETFIIGCVNSIVGFYLVYDGLESLFLMLLMECVVHMVNKLIHAPNLCKETQTLAVIRNFREHYQNYEIITSLLF